MKCLIVLFLLGCAVLCKGQPPEAIWCQEQVNECQCVTNGGHKLDLTQFDSNDAHKPKYWHDATDGYRYMWNPCTPFQTGDPNYPGCTTTAVCQENTKTNPPQWYDGGYHITAQFQYDTEYGMYIRYHTAGTAAAQNIVRTSKVFLSCHPDAEDKFEAFGEVPAGGSGTYAMRFSSKQLCFASNTTSYLGPITRV